MELKLPRVKVCPLTDLPPGEMLKASVEPPIAIYNVDGEVFATSDICSHDRFFLTDGYLDGDKVECSLHFAQFCVRTGRATMAPATKPIATYEVTVDDGEIYVEFPDG